MSENVKRIVFRSIPFSIMVIGAITMLVPFIWMISTSLKADSEVFTFPPTWIPSVFEWRNYPEALGVASFGQYFFNSTFVAIVTTLAALLLNSMAGYAFAKFEFKGRETIFILLLATMMIPFQITMIPIYMLFRELELLNSYTGLIVPNIATAFGIFMMRQFMRNLPDAYMDAARIDGAGEARIFFTIVLPLVRAPLAALGIFTFMFSWNNYFLPLVIITDESLKTLPLLISSLSAGLYVQSWPLVMAAATIATLPIIILFFMAQKYFIDGMALTGIK
ncbi:carbohydrate ABC transporter permease [Shouchella shacheensis]|uniref:carbohydrate ABC transporter permease n=1 Tax=Shouchella shacheensis TaxID=1649580 RepID=UPI0007402663|nr:carbohydrate ABC transporter permease [Shouchella shacheensis]